MRESSPARAAFRGLTAVTDMFASPLRASHYFELVNPLWTTHKLQARVVGVRDETASTRTLILRPGRNWRRHRAGQHVRLGVLLGGMHHTRTYSISSPPERDDDCITITVKAAAGGRVSQHLVRDLVPGTYLPLGLPQGDFVLPDAVPVRPLFITAGSGITPIMSMLRSYAARGPLPSVAHLHYAPHRYDVIFGTELQELAEAHPRYRLHLVYTREHSRAAHSSARRSPRSCGWRSRRLHPLRRDAARLMSPAPHGPEPRRRRCRDRTGRRAERKPTLTARRASGV